MTALKLASIIIGFSASITCISCSGHSKDKNSDTDYSVSDSSSVNNRRDSATAVSDTARSSMDTTHANRNNPDLTK